MVLDVRIQTSSWDTITLFVHLFAVASTLKSSKKDTKLLSVRRKPISKTKVYIPIEREEKKDECKKNTTSSPHFQLSRDFRLDRFL